MADGADRAQSILDPAAHLFLLVVVLSTVLAPRRIARLILFFYIGLVTLNLLLAVTDLVGSLLAGSGNSGVELLSDAFLVWLSTMLVFALLYWLVDGGGPEERQAGQKRRDLWFPQQQAQVPGWERWQPDFWDYLFVAFSASTTFGSNDTQVLSRRAKLLMVAQGITSLIILALIAGRAINILT